ERWLKSLDDSPVSIFASFHCAEVQREKGRWRAAAASYSQVIADQSTPPRLATHAQAARGECHIWLGDAGSAIADLQAATKRIAESEEPYLACVVHLKMGVALRLLRRFPAAVAALERAEEVAVRECFSTEVAK